jgi:hypothetical protein
MKKVTITSLAVLLCTTSIFAQTDEVKYRRSSLSMILIESDNFPEKDAVNKSWNNYPFPDKYNEHNIDTKVVNVDAVKLTDDDLIAAGYLKDTLNNVLKITKAEALSPIRYLNNEKTLAFALPTEKKEYQLKVDKIIKEKDLAKQLVSTWFNRGADGKLDMGLIHKRGFYDASAIEAGIAAGQERGSAVLKDAGQELLKNTFITFTKLNFKENEPAARVVRDAAKLKIATQMAEKPQMLIDKALSQADKLYEKTKEGYTLLSKSWLYQLNWNDSITDVFKKEFWDNSELYANTDLFTLNFVGVQYNQSLVTFKIGEARTQEQIIDLALVRNVDNTFAKLQKQNEVFMPKVPVSSTNPIMAKIGMKEGLSGGEKFDVLEMVWDEKEGRTAWKSVGSCSVDKKAPIWDNRYNAGEDVEPQKDTEGNLVTGTTFKGSKKIQPGMLLKQKK